MMRPEDDCVTCHLVLEAACNVGGPRFCDLKAEYLTTDMPADAMYDRLYETLEDGSQWDRIEAEVNRLAATGWTPPAGPSPGGTPAPASTPALDEAARRWAHNWANGRGA
jgi:hypothetical protein